MMFLRRFGNFKKITDPWIVILNKQKVALLDAERTVETALAKAALVDDLQNKNQELVKQIEINHEGNKTHRQKVAEVEKLTQTVRELEEV
ncbi:Microtubule-associated protein 70-1 [Cardamine amara subsp. amara]|uniref:Microtubule-associated protein 70-1 n=1 Tax=Cardamine amara subsp. amara TaxID=228776 RepID=A0ABD1C9D5_CARAN